MWFSPSIRHVSRSKIHIYSCSQHILMTTITPTTSIKSSISFYSKSIKVFQNTDLRFNKSYLLTSWREREKLMLRFQKRAPSSLHTTRKVAQKDPIFPPWENPNVTFNTTTRCKHNINYSATQELTILIFFI